MGNGTNLWEYVTYGDGDGQALLVWKFRPLNLILICPPDGVDFVKATRAGPQEVAKLERLSAPWQSLARLHQP
jgi:hypothetical protein